MSVVVMDTKEADRILQQAARKSVAVTNRIAHEVLANADPRVPVDTGALKASGAVEDATPGNPTATVSYGGDDVNYAVYQEFGTYKMKAQPFMQPAIEAVSQKYADGKPYEENRILNAINLAILNALNTNEALTTALGSAAYIYHLQAPDLQPCPYVVFSWAGGGDLNITPKSGIEEIIFIRVYHSKAALAGTIDDLVRAALDNNVLNVSGADYTNIWCQREDDYENVEVLPNGESVYAMGGNYRIVIT